MNRRRPTVTVNEAGELLQDLASAEVAAAKWVIDVLVAKVVPIRDEADSLIAAGMLESGMGSQG